MIINLKYIFELPTYVLTPRKTMADKKIMLNMNVYRNLQYFACNQIKQLFKPTTLPTPFKAKKIEISYVVEKPTKRKYDTFNVVSIVDKFFLDWLVKEGYIPDDTCLNVQYSSIIGYNNCDSDKVTATITILEE